MCHVAKISLQNPTLEYCSEGERIDFWTQVTQTIDADADQSAKGFDPLTKSLGIMSFRVVTIFWDTVKCNQHLQ